MQSRQFFGAFLIRRLACFLLRRAGVGCCTLQAGSVGCLPGRLFPRVNGFPFLELIGHREFQRNPFGSRPFNPCTFIGSACLPGSLGLFSRLSIALDSFGGFYPATRGTVAESQHIPELLGSRACFRQLGDLLSPLL
ncbi:hypothetical protein OHA40_14525 [Nocardia sp. NBC_00508]|uniref:hypothetical protein n=1 Tax=Nocardia sp. NBC_00508 TaxID=2975992 RepID=UPI002E801C9A|nr:hypothetical protein [Nocardia sp. NBC_00508]WUD69230.1 hypothetical protein OHA40_14525 [Nocardia sp. NBC_00508]